MIAKPVINKRVGQLCAHVGRLAAGSEIPTADVWRRNVGEFCISDFDRKSRIL